jgi:hypothetical protein
MFQVLLSIYKYKFTASDNIVSIDMFSNLQYIYANIFVEYVTKNPLYKMKMDEPLDCPIFIAKMEEYLFSLPALKSP